MAETTTLTNGAPASAPGSASPAQPTAGGTPAPAGGAQPATPATSTPAPAPASAASAVKPLDGKIALDDDAGLAARHIAFEVLTRAAERVADGVTSSGAENMRVAILTDRALAEADWQHRALTKGLDALASELAAAKQLLESMPEEAEEELDPDDLARTREAMRQAFAPLAAIAGIGTGLAGIKGITESAAAIAQLFRPDYAIKSVTDLSIDATALVTAIAGALDRRNVKVSIDGLARADGPLTTQFFERRNERDELARRLMVFAAERTGPLEHRIAVLREEITATVAAHNAALAAEKPGAGKLEEKVAGLNARLAAAEVAAGPALARAAVAKAAVERFDAFAIAATSVPEGGTATPLALAAARHWLRDDDTERHDVLFVELESAGAEMVSRQSYWSSPQLVAMGGVVISWTLASLQTGQIYRAGTVPLLGSGKVDLKDGELDELKLTPKAEAAATPGRRAPRAGAR